MPSDAVGAVLVQVRGLLDTVGDAPMWSLDDRRIETRLGQALTVKAGVDELVARLVAQVDDRGLASTTGSSSTRGHLMVTHRVSAAAAASMLTWARTCTDRTDSTRQAWAAGSLHTDQAMVIASAVDKIGVDVPDPAVQAAQLDLVCHAQDLSHTQLQIAANHLVEVVDPDGADGADERLAAQLQTEEERARQTTCFRGRKGLDGIATYSGKMPNLQFDMLTTALHAIASPRRNTTTAHDIDSATGGKADGDLNTGGGGGRDPTGRRGAQRRPEGAAPAPASQPTTGIAGAATAGLVGPFATTETDPAKLSYGQRMGLALVELLEHLPTDALPQHGVTNATIVVNVDHHNLATGLGEAILSTGDTVSVAQTRRLACNAGLLPSCSELTPPSSTSVSPDAATTATNASPWPPETAAASWPAAKDHRPGAKHITSDPGQPAAPPTWPTGACCAPTTTTSSTNAGGPSQWHQTAYPKSSHPNTSTQTRNRSGTRG